MKIQPEKADKSVPPNIYIAICKKSFILSNNFNEALKSLRNFFQIFCISRLGINQINYSIKRILSLITQINFSIVYNLKVL